MAYLTDELTREANAANDTHLNDIYRFKEESKKVLAFLNDAAKNGSLVATSEESYEWIEHYNNKDSILEKRFKDSTCDWRPFNIEQLYDSAEVYYLVCKVAQSTNIPIGLSFEELGFPGLEKEFDRKYAKIREQRNPPAL